MNTKRVADKETAVGGDESSAGAVVEASRWLLGELVNARHPVPETSTNLASHRSGLAVCRLSRPSI